MLNRQFLSRWIAQKKNWPIVIEIQYAWKREMGEKIGKLSMARNLQQIFQHFSVISLSHKYAIESGGKHFSIYFDTSFNCIAFETMPALSEWAKQKRSTIDGNRPRTYGSLIVSYVQ